MYKIKEFSLRCGVSVDTLKYYDAIDLFKPMVIDKTNGYRYYDALQLHDINRILALKASHFSLAEIKGLMNRGLSHEELLVLMQDKASLLEQEIQQMDQQLHQLYTSIFMMKNGGISLMQEVIVKEVEEVLVISKKEIIKLEQESFDEFCERMWGQVEQFIEHCNLKKSASCMSLYYSGFFINTDKPVEIEVAIPVIGEDADWMKSLLVSRLPKQQVASIVHEGDFKTIGETYDVLITWLTSNQYQPCGPIREIYHKGEWICEDRDSYITELQVPFH